FEVVLFEKVFAIKEQLRIADVRQREQISVFIRMLTNRQRRADEVITRPRESPLLISRSEVRETILTRESREPRIIEHYQIVCAGPRAQIDQLFFKQVVVRELGDVYVHAVQGFVIERGLFKRIAFDA